MSSASRSGISSRISAGVRPETNSSSTSVTRILIPRTQGRPPHCPGFVVMRLKRSAMSAVSHFASVSATGISKGERRQAILARMINDAKSSSCDHRKALNIGASGSSAWKLPGPNNGKSSSQPPAGATSSSWTMDSSPRSTCACSQSPVPCSIPSPNFVPPTESPHNRRDSQFPG
jgi:hypothetical protein